MLLNVFKIMHVADKERVYLTTYQMEGVAVIWFVQWKMNRSKGAPPKS